MQSTSPSNGPTPRVLFVDDEPVMLRSVERYLKTWDDRWDVVCVNEAEAALRTMDSQTFDVVVSDLHMPKMDGVTLLGEVQRRHPGTVRILLSGNEDRQRAALATRAAHQFLDKGSSPSRLRVALERARALRGVIADEELRTTMTATNKLSSAPPLFAELTAALQDPNVSVMQIAAIIERDPAMTARILQVVSSAFFALPRRVTDVGEAISFLGADIVRVLVLQAELFNAAPPRARGFDMDVFQQHSFATSRIAGGIARDLGMDQLIVMATLLHDVGSLVLASRVPERWEEAARRAQEVGEPMHVAERELMGVSHAEIGGFLLGIWAVDEEIVDAITFHHHTPKRPRHKLKRADVICIADALVHDPDADIHPNALAADGVEERLDRWRARAARLFD